MLLSQIQSNDWSLSLESAEQVVQGAADIEQCIRIILTTRPGEDPLRPLFGCDIFQYIDGPVTDRARIIKSIYDALELWEPRIEVTGIFATINISDMYIRIAYRILNTVNTGQVEITYALTL